MLSSCLGVLTGQPELRWIAQVLYLEIPGVTAACLGPGGFENLHLIPRQYLANADSNCAIVLRGLSQAPHTIRTLNFHSNFLSMFTVRFKIHVLQTIFTEYRLWILFTHSEPSVRSPRGLYIGDVTRRAAGAIVFGAAGRRWGARRS